MTNDNTNNIFFSKITHNLLHIFNKLENDNNFFLRPNIFFQDIADYHQYLCGKYRVLLALSGGSDSVALLYALCHIQKTYNFSLACAYINHGLQEPEEQSHEKDVVSHTAKKLGITLYIDDTKMQQALNSQEASEEEARIFRYDRLLSIAKHHAYNCIATAHHNNDVSETIFMQFLSGRTLSTIPQYRVLDKQWGTNNQIYVIRPYLGASWDEGVSVEEIYNVCNNFSLMYHTDISNKDCKYTRNAIRNKIFPAIAQSIEQPIAQSVAQSIEQPIAQSVAQSVAQSIAQSIAQSSEDFEKKLFSCVDDGMERNLSHDWFIEKHDSRMRLRVTRLFFERLSIYEKKQCLLSGLNYLGIGQVRDVFLDEVIRSSHDNLQQYYIENIQCSVDDKHVILQQSSRQQSLQQSSQLAYQEKINISEYLYDDVQERNIVWDTTFLPITISIVKDYVPINMRPINTQLQNNIMLTKCSALYVDRLSKHDTLLIDGKHINIKSLLMRYNSVYRWNEVPVLRDDNKVLAVMGETMLLPKYIINFLHNKLTYFEKTVNSNEVIEILLQLSYGKALLLPKVSI